MDKQFEPESEAFTLEVIITFGFDQYAQHINDISIAATKELAIENVSTLIHCAEIIYFSVVIDICIHYS